MSTQSFGQLLFREPPVEVSQLSLHTCSSLCFPDTGTPQWPFSGGPTSTTLAEVEEREAGQSADICDWSGGKETLGKCLKHTDLLVSDQVLIIQVEVEEVG